MTQPLFTEQPRFTLDIALQKLKWSDQNGEFSATLKPAECRALLEHVEQMRAAVVEVQS